MEVRPDIRQRSGLVQASGPEPAAEAYLRAPVMWAASWFSAVMVKGCSVLPRAEAPSASSD
jgi:hypothetical protein